MKYLYFLLVITIFSCKDDDLRSSCFIEDRTVTQVINTNLPEYFDLKNLGAFVYLDGGVRGVFLVHNYDDKYYAIERTCTFQPDDDCSKIFVDSTTIQLKCGNYQNDTFVKCCQSRFTFDGRVLQGPALCNLKMYRVNLVGDELYLSN